MLQVVNSFLGEDLDKGKAFGSAFLQCFSIAFFYAYAVFSSRLRNEVGISSSEVVLLGVLSQTGLGLVQFPMTKALNFLHKQMGLSHSRLDFIISMFSGLLFTSSMCGIGAILTMSENGNNPGYQTSIGALGFCFFAWGAAAGITFNSASTVVNFNNVGSNSRRRAQLVALSFAVGLGGVIIVILYYYVFARSVSLSAFFFGLAIFYFGITFLRVKWMVRVKQKVVSSGISVKAKPDDSQGAGYKDIVKADEPRTDDEHNDGDESSLDADIEIQQNLPMQRPSTDVIRPQPLKALLKSDIVWLTCLSTFLGVGIGGTFLSSLGNLGSQLSESDITFSLTLIFLIMQTVGRLINALAYGYADWPYIFAFWQAFCLAGVAVFLITPTPMGAYFSSALVGLSFGGAYSSFPIIAATSFPGNPTVDYPQSVGIAFGMASIGCVCVGQITTVIYNAASIQDLRKMGFFGMFMFFAGLLVVSVISAFVLGYKIRYARQRAKQTGLASQAGRSRTVLEPPMLGGEQNREADLNINSEMLQGTSEQASGRHDDSMDQHWTSEAQVATV